MCAIKLTSNLLGQYCLYPPDQKEKKIWAIAHETRDSIRWQ